MVPAVLGFDTSAAWCSVALVRGPATFERRAEVGSAHSAHLLPMVDAVLGDARMALGDCDAIAFGAGPGSFTGLRVACAAAQGLAYGASLPVAPIGTLDALAHSVADRVGAGRLLVAQDARMGEVYWSAMTAVDGRWVVVDPPAVSRPHDLRARGGVGRTAVRYPVGVGNAWAVHGDALDGLVEHVVHRPAADAVDVARLGVAAFVEGRAGAPDRAAPIYVRNDVAQTTAERAATAAARAAAA